MSTVASNPLPTSLTMPSTTPTSTTYPELYKTTFTYPAIDNHAHNLLNLSKANSFPLEGLAGEASGPAQKDLVNTIALKRAARQIAPLYNIPPDILTAAEAHDGKTWDVVKEYREKSDYEEIVKRCFRFEDVRIQCLLLDDLLSGIGENCWDYKDHDRFLPSKTKRILRVEVVAQVRPPPRFSCIRSPLLTDCI